MKQYLKILIAFLTLTCYGSVQQSKAQRAEADSAYAAEEYQRALDLYSKVEPSAAVYYNMGNCYYRLDSISAAILYYERAHLLSPGNSDIEFNLNMARGKTVDKLVPRSEFFFIDWYRSLSHAMSVDSWAYWAIASFVVALVLLLVWLFVAEGRLRSVCAGGFAVLLVVCLLSNLFAWSQHRDLEYRTGAIVMANTFTVKSTPSKSGTDLFVLHEGTRVNITDDTLEGWFEVELEDGKQGWIQRSAVEVI